MARTVPAAVTTRLANDLGEKPMVVVECLWNGDDGSTEFYAEQKIPTAPHVKPKVLSVPPFDEVVQITGGGQSSEVPVELSDSDGAIKALFNTIDFHKITVQLWFYLQGTDFETEKLKLFRGQINSPVNWTEGGRRFAFSVVNRIEDVEVGFSAEEGDFPKLPEELIGKTWPLCFGTTINVPALKAVPAVSGILAGDGVGIRDFTLERRIALAEEITCPQTPIGYRCATVASGAGTYRAVCNIAYETDQSCLQARCVEIERLNLELEEQTSYEFSQITIFGGDEFPQGRRITLNIQGGLFTGRFDGTPTNPTDVFSIESRRHPDNDGNNQVIVEPEQTEIESKCPSGVQDAQDSDFTETAYGPVFTGIRTSRVQWEAYRNELPANFFWAAGGATVTMQTRQEIVYVANIIPSTVRRVAAWRTLNGNRFLLTVPNAFYTVRQTDFTGYQVMEIVFQRPLSSEQQSRGGGWSDDIYVTQISSVGPNTVDILEWFIDTYTSYAKDGSFATIKPKLENYPMHFPLLDRPNILTILSEIARQARCALWLKDDTFFLKYLSETPTPVDDIGEADILADDETGLGTLEIELTPTDGEQGLITKYTLDWKKDHSLDDPNTLILRHNVNKYGTHATRDDYFTFAHLKLVLKTGTFWLIRRANTWKRIRFSTSLEFINLEAFDAVTFTLPDVATDPFVGIIEKAVLDSANKQINFEAWTPIRAGEMEPYDFAYPADIARYSKFPSDEARDRNEAGSGNEPNFSTIAPPGHPLETNTSGVYSGISLGCNGEAVVSLEPGVCRQDFGDRNPSDTGDTKPGVNTPSGTSKQVSEGSSPISNGSRILDYWSWQRKFKDQQDKTENDAGRGRETAQRGGEDGNEAQTEEDVNRDFLDELPDPDDLNIPCQVNVTVSGFHTSESGTRPICLPGAPRTEVYAFNSWKAAQAFCDQLKANSRCGSEAPCLQCITAGGCALTKAAGDENCEPEDGDVPGVVGFRGAPGFDDKSFMDCPGSGQC